MASGVLSSTLWTAFCLLLCFLYAVHGKTAPFVKAFLPHGHQKSYNVSSSIQPDDDAVGMNYFVVFRSTGQYYGAKAVMTVYSHPQIKENQETATVLWLVTGTNGPKEKIGVVTAGWHVRPQLYGDTKTHLFTYWTADFYISTGCFNLECPAFVLNPNSPWRPGDVVKPTSQVNGQQYVITLSITKDKQTGDWVLKTYKDDKEFVIGHWPKSLFDNTSDYADEIIVGGEVGSPSNEPSGPMGSGLLGSEREGNASYIANTQYVDVYGTFRKLGGERVRFQRSHPDCQYGWALDSRTKLTFTKFYYGGPGGCTVSSKPTY